MKQNLTDILIGSAATALTLGSIGSGYLIAKNANEIYQYFYSMMPDSSAYGPHIRAMSECMKGIASSIPIAIAEAGCVLTAALGMKIGYELYKK